MTIEDGVKLGLGIAGAFAALWIAGWILVALIVGVVEALMEEKKG